MVRREFPCRARGNMAPYSPDGQKAEKEIFIFKGEVRGGVKML